MGVPTAVLFGVRGHIRRLIEPRSCDLGGQIVTRLSSLWVLLLCLSVKAQVGDSFSIQAEDGTFEFSNLSVKNSSFPYLRGDVINKTNRDWIQVDFEVIVYDKNGNTLRGLLLSNPRLTLAHFKRGTTQALGYGKDGAMLDVQGKAARIELRFAGGTFETTYIVSLKKPAAREDLSFEDDVLSIQWIFGKKMLGFVLRNKTDNPIKIDWNQISYIDIAGNAQKVIHKEVRLITRNDPLVPTLIPPTAKLEDMILPTANVQYESGRFGGWRQRPMFPDGGAAKEYKGKSFSVFMPLEINGSTKTYTFTIQVDDVKY
jgi:hypothetical protein